ncbi:hypothetical protein M3Y97_00913800 [Aphelenchoides bicaudatus]|nr:hypothetical protein M3Y97_00913800 [Aphelenchoides bicaudatus]
MYLPTGNWSDIDFFLDLNDSVVDFFDDNTDYGNFSDYDLELRQVLKAAAHEPNTESFRDLIALLVVLTSILGLIINFFILIISVWNIRGDYRLFIANLAAVDIACALLYAFMGYVNLTENDHHHISSAIMSYLAFSFYGSFGILIFALIPVSVSRVMAASKPKVYDQFFSGRSALLFCIVSDLLPVVLLCIICVARHDIAKWLFFGYAVLTVIAHVVTFVANTMVFRMVARHISVVQCLHDRVRLLETKQVALATCAQAVLPLICQIPAFLTLSSALLLVRPLTNANLIFITQLWLAASPLFDGLITLFVIKQYRIQTIAFFSLVFRTECCGGVPQKKSITANVVAEQHHLSSMYSSSIIPLKKIRVIRT